MSSELFPNISLSARLFVYTANKDLNNEDADTFISDLEEFISEWKAHGSNLDASHKLIANRVLIIAVDEKAQTATGCSIDSLNRWLQASGHDWFARNWVLYNTNSSSLNENWIVADLFDFHDKCKTGQISLDNFVLNTTVLSVEEGRQNLVQKVSESWHVKML